MRTIHCIAIVALALLAGTVDAQDGSKFDAGLAQATGADEHGMRGYVLVILKTGKRVPDGADRDEMF
jgi:hypothetical protein